MNIIIIEDEPLMADALEKELKQVDPGCSIITKLSSIRGALHYFEQGGTLPDLFFSDIELTDGLSFEIFRAREFNVPVVFCTAYSEYALDAFKANGIDYILKPFETQDIESTLVKYKKMVGNRTSNLQQVEQLIQAMASKENQKDKTLLVHHGDKITPIDTSEIALIFIELGLVTLITFSQKRFPLNYTMDHLQEVLGHDFYRLNRQFIIHRKAIQHVARYQARKLLVKPTIDFKDNLFVSKTGTSQFLAWLSS